MFSEETFKKIMEAILIDCRFKFPITFVMIGVNGAIMAARFKMAGDKLKTDVLYGRAKNLRFPINVMFADAEGKAAHVLFKNPKEDGDLKRLFNLSETPPIGWPKA